MKILVFTLLFSMILIFNLGRGEEISWEKKLNDHRRNKDVEFKTSPVSPLAGWQRLMASPGEMILDLNYAFNPLCNYSGVYNCPIPPAENELSVAVRAGEKTYPIGH